jgi:site-specific recombinase XerD
LLFLYNTGARVQEAAQLRVAHLELDAPARVRLHGKGGKWRSCPLWEETTRRLRLLLDQTGPPQEPEAPVFAARGRPLSRFGIYKIVRRHAQLLERRSSTPRPRITPHVFRHTAAVHLLEAGVEVNVIRGWLGHADLTTTNRYAEITVRSKETALRACEPPVEGASGRPAWRDDRALLDWLASL